MREIISLHVGGCGIAIAQEFWGVVCGEHGIAAHGKYNGNNCLQRDRIDVLFNENGKNRFHARAILIDTDPTSIETVKSGSLSLLFEEHLMLSDECGTGNNFAKGYQPDGDIIRNTMEAIRQETEKTDALQGFQYFHSLGGGTGAGLSTLIWEHISYEYPKILVQTASIVPSAKTAETIVEPYNCLLCFPSLIDNTHLTFSMDNEALYDISVKQLGLCTPSLRDANHLIAHAMSGVTTCLRFPGQLNSGLRKLYVNMCPFPNLHMLVPGFAPLTSLKRTCYATLTVPDLVKQIFSSKNLLAEIDLRCSKFLTVAAIFRGLISSKQVDTLMFETKSRCKDNFINWIPNHIKTAICDVPPMGLDMSATFIGNTSGIVELYRRILKSFDVMFQRKAYLHCYINEGIEESDFAEARERMTELFTEYEEAAKDIDIAEEDCLVD